MLRRLLTKYGIVNFSHKILKYKLTLWSTNLEQQILKTEIPSHSKQDVRHKLICWISLGEL